MSRLPASDEYGFHFQCRDCNHYQVVGISMQLIAYGEAQVEVQPCYCVGDSPFGPGNRDAVRARRVAPGVYSVSVPDQDRGLSYYMASVEAAPNPQPSLDTLRVRGPTIQELTETARRIADPPAAQPIRAQLERKQPPEPTPEPAPVDERPDATVRFSLLELK